MTDAIPIIIQTAADEALATGYAEIAPAHLLIALSRFSDTSQLAAADPAMSQVLAGEFAALSISPQPFRRRLRALIAAGQTQLAGDAIHRSTACKAVFADAERLAAQEGAVPDARYLLRAIFRLLANGDPLSGQLGGIGQAQQQDFEIPDEL